MHKCLWLYVLLCAALCLGTCPCHPRGAQAPAPTQPPAIVPAPDAPLTYLYFRESGSYYKRVQASELRLEDGQYTAYFYMANEEELYPVPVDQAWVDTLTSFIDQYNMMAWDGFEQSADGLLDGTFFSCDFTFANGVGVLSSGYGCFPDGYGDASSAMERHFLQLLPEDMRDW